MKQQRHRGGGMQVLAVVAIASVGVAIAAQDTTPVAIHSFQDTSCGAWTKSQGNQMARAQSDAWFREFVSGYNFANPSNQVSLGRMPDDDTLHLYVDKYCRENPLNPFVSAGFDLVRELREHR